MKRLYKDFFFHTDIFVMMLLVLTGLGILVIHGLAWPYMGYFLLGLMGFAFSEYLTHRFLFHIKAPKNHLFLKFMKRIHYDHHAYPNDLKLLFLPLWYSLPNFALFELIFYLFTGNVFDTIAFGMGLMSMLLIYEWKHYVAHRPIKPRTKFGQWVKKTHILHHFKNENYWYGVSTPFADFLFGTYKDEKEVETSVTVKELEKRA